MRTGIGTVLALAIPRFTVRSNEAIHIISDESFNIHTHQHKKMIGWLVVSIPLKNISELGYMGK